MSSCGVRNTRNPYPITLQHTPSCLQCLLRLCIPPSMKLNPLGLNKWMDAILDTRIASLVKGIKDVEEMLNFNVIQGKKNERGSYVVKLSSQQSEAMGSHTEISHVDANAGDLPDKVETTVSSTPGVKKEA
ncbi:unnamed protein product [Choristocarpus tenellus]